ncbi:hypothetical protein Tco_0925641 [Tanacetum coccineum]|uniref:Uncharacterized protein n=1 Tax=Tanacetum coccineum TaxID=301880 RepID=A0ABQ5DA21_9ASTR
MLIVFPIRSVSLLWGWTCLEKDLDPYLPLAPRERPFNSSLERNINAPFLSVIAGVLFVSCGFEPMMVLVSVAVLRCLLAADGGARESFCSVRNTIGFDRAGCGSGCVLPAREVATDTQGKDHPSLATGTAGKTFAGLRQLMLHVAYQSARTADIPVYTAVAIVTFARENVGVTPMLDIAGSSPARDIIPAVRCFEVKDLEVVTMNIVCCGGAQARGRRKGEVVWLTVSTLHAAFQDFKEKAEAQQEEQAQAYRVYALGRVWILVCRRAWMAGYEHGVAGTPLSATEAYNPEAARTSYLDAVRALEDADLPLVNLLKSKKDAGRDEVLGLTLSGTTWVGETSTSAAPISVEDFDEEDTDEALGSVVAIPKFEAFRF